MLFIIIIVEKIAVIFSQKQYTFSLLLFVLFCFVFLRLHGIIDTDVQIKPTCSKRYV